MNNIKLLFTQQSIYFNIHVWTKKTIDMVAVIGHKGSESINQIDSGVYKNTLNIRLLDVFFWKFFKIQIMLVRVNGQNFYVMTQAQKSLGEIVHGNASPVFGRQWWLMTQLQNLHAFLFELKRIARNF